MGAIKSYLHEATILVESHPTWSMESLVNRFRVLTRCEEGTAIYFIEKAIEDSSNLYIPDVEMMGDDYYDIL